MLTPEANPPSVLKSYTPGNLLHQQIERALTEFGRELLTARERHVVHLILLGLPSKVAAIKLRIAPKTERVHRRNAYAKLGVKSQAELFRQFLGFLSTCWTQVDFPDTSGANRAGVVVDLRSAGLPALSRAGASSSPTD